jgi:hypothetical protein
MGSVTAIRGRPDEPMSEADLLTGICEALTLGGWVWTHIRRSDGITVGNAGLPDIIAAHHGRTFMLAWELKADRGTVSVDQYRWLHALGPCHPTVDARVIRPQLYDAALRVLLYGETPGQAFE